MAVSSASGVNGRNATGSLTSLGAPRRTAPFPFLCQAVIPDVLWLKLTPGERWLHLLWTKKFASVYEDYERISPRDIPEDERQTVRAMLSTIAERKVAFHGPVSFPGSVERARFYRANTTLMGERFALEVGLPQDDDRVMLRPRISLRAVGRMTSNHVVLEWQPRNDPSRGSVLLSPNAATRARYQFGIAAFNYAQFLAITEALADYLVRR